MNNNFFLRSQHIGDCSNKGESPIAHIVTVYLQH